MTAPADPRNPKKSDVRDIADLLPTSDSLRALANDVAYHHLVRRVLTTCVRAIMEVRPDLLPQDGWSMPPEYDFAMFYADFPKFPYALDCFRSSLSLPVLPTGMPLSAWRRSALYDAWHTVHPQRKDDRHEIMCFDIENSRSIYMCTTVSKAISLPLYICFRDEYGRSVYVAEYTLKNMQTLLA